MRQNFFIGVWSCTMISKFYFIYCLSRFYLFRTFLAFVSIKFLLLFSIKIVSKNYFSAHYYFDTVVVDGDDDGYHYDSDNNVVAPVASD